MRGPTDGKAVAVELEVQWAQQGQGQFSYTKLVVPQTLKFYCPSCGGEPRTFYFLTPSSPYIKANVTPGSAVLVPDEVAAHIIATYACPNCQFAFKKIIGLSVVRNLWTGPGDSSRTDCVLRKTTEWPSAFPPLPEELYRMAKDNDAEAILIQGYKCEKQLMGVAALAYYRRVLVACYKYLLQRILGVAIDRKSSPEFIKELTEAVETTQVKRALGNALPCMPEGLMFGHTNPLLVLHENVSGEMKEGTDEESLGQAAELRDTLARLTRRIDHVLDDSKALTNRVQEADRKHQEKWKAKNAAKNGSPAVVEDPAGATEVNPG